MLPGALSIFLLPTAGSQGRLFMRQWLVLIHRWTGLTTAIFLAVAGITGAILAFRDDVEAVLNPQLFVVSAPAGQMAELFIDPFLLREKVQRLYPQARVDHMSFAQPGLSQMFYLSPRINSATGQPFSLAVNQVFVNPYTSDVLGDRNWGQIYQNGQFHRENIVPFLWRLHAAFALPHPWGQLLMGVVALIWTIDSVVGLMLTFPFSSPFFRKWRMAWKIKIKASIHRLNLDIHRSSALWSWIALLLFAWSSVMLNLGTQIYQPVMSSILAFDERPRNFPIIQPLSRPIEQPLLEWHNAYQHASAALHAAALRDGFSILSEDSFWYRPAMGAYLYRTRTTLDKSDHHAGTNLWIDGTTGKVLREDYLGYGRSGDIVSKWLRVLHTGAIFGVGYSIIIVLLGCAVALLSMTGIWIWWKKRQIRKHVAKRAIK